MRAHKARGAKKVELQMTSMIDVVFQLLVFFIMTFNVVEAEGDFAIQLPGGPSQDEISCHMPIKLRLHMTADARGQLDTMTFNNTVMNKSRPFDDLHQRVVDFLTKDGRPPEFRDEVEVVLKCDEQLHYDNVIQAITAVSGDRQFVDGQDVTTPLIEKVRFARPMRSGNE